MGEAVNAGVRILAASLLAACGGDPFTLAPVISAELLPDAADVDADVDAEEADIGVDGNLDDVAVDTAVGDVMLDAGPQDAARDAAAQDTSLQDAGIDASVDVCVMIGDKCDPSPNNCCGGRTCAVASDFFFRCQ